MVRTLVPTQQSVPYQLYRHTSLIPQSIGIEKISDLRPNQPAKKTLINTSNQAFRQRRFSREKKTTTINKLEITRLDTFKATFTTVSNFFFCCILLILSAMTLVLLLQVLILSGFNNKKVHV